MLLKMLINYSEYAKWKFYLKNSLTPKIHSIIKLYEYNTYDPMRSVVPFFSPTSCIITKFLVNVFSDYC